MRTASMVFVLLAFGCAELTYPCDIQVEGFCFSGSYEQLDMEDISYTIEITESYLHDFDASFSWASVDHDPTAYVHVLDSSESVDRECNGGVGCTVLQDDNSMDAYVIYISSEVVLPAFSQCIRILAVFSHELMHIGGYYGLRQSIEDHINHSYPHFFGGLGYKESKDWDRSSVEYKIYVDLVDYCSEKYAQAGF